MRACEVMMLAKKKKQMNCIMQRGSQRGRGRVTCEARGEEGERGVTLTVGRRRGG